MIRNIRVYESTKRRQVSKLSGKAIWDTARKLPDGKGRGEEEQWLCTNPKEKRVV